MIARAVCVLLGAWAGALGVVVHRQRDAVLDVDVPWGAAAALVLVLAVGGAASSLVPLGAAWAGGGWALMLLATQLGRDVWVAGDALGWVFALGGLAGFVVIGWRTGERTSGSTL